MWSGICVISATRSKVERFFGQTVVVFAEPPMRYICTFDDDGNMIHAADSIRILGRITEFESVYQKYLKQRDDD